MYLSYPCIPHIRPLVPRFPPSRVRTSLVSSSTPCTPHGSARISSIARIPPFFIPRLLDPHLLRLYALRTFVLHPSCYFLDTYLPRSPYLRLRSPPQRTFYLFIAVLCEPSSLTSFVSRIPYSSPSSLFVLPLSSSPTPRFRFGLRVHSVSLPALPSSFLLLILLRPSLPSSLTFPHYPSSPLLLTLISLTVHPSLLPLRSALSALLAPLVSTRLASCTPLRFSLGLCVPSSLVPHPPRTRLPHIPSPHGSARLRVIRVYFPSVFVPSTSSSSYFPHSPLVLVPPPRYPHFLVPHPSYPFA